MIVFCLHVVAGREFLAFFPISRIAQFGCLLVNLREPFLAVCRFVQAVSGGQLGCSDASLRVLDALNGAKRLFGSRSVTG